MVAINEEKVFLPEKTGRNSTTEQYLLTTKTQFIMKKNFMSAIIIASMIAMAPAAFAGNNNGKKGKNGKTETVRNTNSNIDVQYVGEADGLVLLLVKVQKTGSGSGLLRIADGYGEVLHTERVAKNSYARYIKVSPDELTKIEVTYDTSEGFGRKRYNLTVSRQEEFSIVEVAAH
jgi:hypothetical protein